MGDHYEPFDQSKSVVLQEIKKYIKLGYVADDFLIIAASVKSKSTPVRTVGNFITDYITKCPVDDDNYETYSKFGIHVSTSDDAPSPSEKVINGKILLCTYHQAKGLERKIVFVMGFDNSYYVFNAKTSETNYCPNIMYVAATRVLEHLILVHNDNMAYLPFLDQTKISEYCDVIGTLGEEREAVKEEKSIFTVTQLISHLSSDIIDSLYNMLIKTDIRINKKLIHIPNEIKQPYGYEEVSEITGTAIPAYLEFKISGKCAIYDSTYKYLNKSDAKEPDPLDDLPNDLMSFDASDYVDESCEHVLLEVKTDVNFHDCFKSKEAFYAMLSSDDDKKPNKLLYVATRYCSSRSGYKFKNVQIKYHTWLSINNLNKCYERCKRLNISKNAKFEYASNCDIKIRKYHDQLINVCISGVIDCKDKYNIYEFKCVKEIKKEHFLQLAIYMYLHQREIINKYCKSHELEINYRNVPASELCKYHYYLYNISTDDLYEIKCQYNTLHSIILQLISEKNKDPVKKTDDIFISSNLLLARKYQ